MKVFYFVFLILALGGNCARGQELQGSFTTIARDITFESDLLQFNGSHFLYKRFHCTGTDEGNGSFAVAGGRLVLRFEEPAAPAIVTALPYAGDNYLPVFYFKVLNSASEALPGATVISRKSPVIGASTNELGEAQLAYPPADGNTLVVSTVGFAPVYIPVLSWRSQRFSVSMGNITYISAGAVYSFPVRKLRSNSFILQRYPVNKGPFSRYRYARITSEKARALGESR